MEQQTNGIKKIHECGMAGKCYICGKTSADFFQLLEMPTILPIFKQEISQNLTETKSLYSNFVLRMQSLLTDTANYKLEITYAQFQENRDLYRKMMPKGEDLLTFCPDDEDQANLGMRVKSHDSCMLKDMRANIQYQLEKLNQGHLTKFLRKHNPILSQKLEQYYSDAQATASISSDAIHFLPFSYDYLCDMHGDIVIPTSQRGFLEYYSLQAFNEQGKIFDGVQPINSVLQIKFKYELCPICAARFNKN